MAFIEKELLLSRVKYLVKINEKPGLSCVNPTIVDKINSMIEKEELLSFMQVESVFNYLVEKSVDQPNELDRYASEILDFIN